MIIPFLVGFISLANIELTRYITVLMSSKSHKALHIVRFQPPALEHAAKKSWSEAYSANPTDTPTAAHPTPKAGTSSKHPSSIKSPHPFVRPPVGHGWKPSQSKPKLSEVSNSTSPTLKIDTQQERFNSLLHRFFRGMSVAFIPVAMFAPTVGFYHPFRSHSVHRHCRQLLCTGSHRIHSLYVKMF